MNNACKLQDLLLLQLSCFFDTAMPSERLRSRELLRSLMLDLQKVLKPDCCLEIGAFDAMFSVDVKRLLPSARVVAFEANPYNYNHVKSLEYISQSGIEYLHKAVSSTTGVVNFYVQRFKQGEAMAPIRGNNSMLKRNEENVEYEMVEVDSIAIDDFLESVDVGDFSSAAWIDVEGAIGDVLNGAAKSLQKFGTILLEVEDDEKWEGQWLSSDVVRFLSDNGFSAVARDFEYPSQYNILFCNNQIIGLPEVRKRLAGFYFSCNSVASNKKNNKLSAGLGLYRRFVNLFPFLLK